MDLKGRVQLKENKVNVSWENICVPFQWFDWLERWNVATGKECRHNSANWVYWKFRSIVKYGEIEFVSLWQMAFRQTTFHSVHTHNTFIGNTLLRHFVRVLFLLSLSPFISFFPFVLNVFIRIAANNLLESGCVCVLGQAHRHSYVLCGFGFQTAPNICLECIHTDICLSFSVFSLEFF